MTTQRDLEIANEFLLGEIADLRSQEGWLRDQNLSLRVNLKQAKAQADLWRELLAEASAKLLATEGTAADLQRKLVAVTQAAAPAPAPAPALTSYLPTPDRADLYDLLSQAKANKIEAIKRVRTLFKLEGNATTAWPSLNWPLKFSKDFIEFILEIEGRKPDKEGRGNDQFDPY